MATCQISKIDSNVTGLSYAEEECLKQLPVAGPAVAATGTLTIAAQPSVSDTVDVNGTLYTFNADGSGTNGVEIGTDADDTADNLALALAADTDITAAASANVVTITAAVPGAAGNTIALITPSASVVASGAFLSGGSDANLGTFWYGLEPNSYSDLGGELTTMARAPIDPSRQNKKGTVVDLDADGGFNQDFTQTNLTRLLQGFFFADARQAFGTDTLNGAPIAIGAVAPSAYAASSGLDAFVAGQLLYASGFGNPANNGLKRVTTSSAVSVTVAEVLVVEASPPAAAKLESVGWSFPAGDVAMTLVGGLAVLVGSGSVDFTLIPNLIPGAWVFLGGDATASRFTNAYGYARIGSLTAMQIVFDEVTWVPEAEAGAGKTIQMFTGTIIRNEKQPSLIKRRSYNIERTLGEGANGTQAEYLEGAVANELTLNVPQADKLNVDLTFVACDNTYVSGDPGDELKTGTRVSAPAEDAYNTSSDIYRIKLHVHDAASSNPANLFGYVSEATLSINNGVTPNKALGVLGAFDTSAGNFEVTGSMTAYFETVAAAKAIRANADVGFSAIFAAKNKGFLFDMPLLGLGGGRIQVEANEPVMIPVEPNGAESKYGHTLLYMQFQYLPSVAMPQ